MQCPVRRVGQAIEGADKSAASTASQRGSDLRCCVTHELAVLGLQVSSDGYLVIGANTQRSWEQTCRVLGREDLVDNSRFATNLDRLHNREELEATLEATLKSRTTEEWVDVLLAAGVPCGPIQDLEEVCRDPHVLAREMVVETTHPVEGQVRNLGIPVKMSHTPGRVRRPAPLLGEHTDDVLARHGFTREEIGLLREKGVVG